ncbi:MAG: hypothetical protein QOJ06_3456, partial [Pseudonocardiales bacterium]|nr:hypothetical protein [Pseudonocardiales bacterium]
MGAVVAERLLHSAPGDPIVAIEA